MNLNTFKGNVRSFGVAKAMADVTLRAANRLILLKVLKGIRIEAVDRSFLDCDRKYRGLFLDETALRRFAADPRNELSHPFLDQALAKGDECYGFLAGDVLAAYGWYSRQPTDLEWPGLRLLFSDRYVYMYKGFTANEHRGQRLHAIGMTRALESFLDRGCRGIVSYVEWNNFASLKSCYRMGYRDFGQIAIARIDNHYALIHDRGCRELDFLVERKDDSSPRPSPSPRPAFRSQ